MFELAAGFVLKPLIREEYENLLQDLLRIFADQGIDTSQWTDGRISILSDQELVDVLGNMLAQARVIPFIG
jgi:hypothetical protein